MTTVGSAGAPGGAALFRHGDEVTARRMATPMWLRAASYWGYQYRRTWRSSVVTSFLIPVLYLAAMGVALGSLIDKHSHGVGGVTYVAFLAPGLLAGTCMQIGTNDATYPVMGAIKWMRTYLAQLAAPLERLRRAARPPGLDRGPPGHRGHHLPGRHGGLRGRLLALGDPRPAGRCAHRHRVRRAGRGLRGHAGQGLVLLDALPLRHHPDVPLLGHLLPHLAAARRGWRRWPTSRPSTTGWRCAATSRSARSAGRTSGTWPTCAPASAVGYAAARRTFARRLVV